MLNNDFDGVRCFSNERQLISVCSFIMCLLKFCKYHRVGVQGVGIRIIAFYVD